MASSEKDSRPKLDSDPGFSPESVQLSGGEIDKTVVFEVLKYIKKQNKQQQENNRSQKETNNRTARVTKLLISLTIMVVLMFAGTVVAQVQSWTVLYEVQQLVKDYQKLNKDLKTLSSNIDKRLDTTPAEVSKQIEKLERKVDEGPKVVADDKGDLRLEVPVDMPKEHVAKEKGVPEKPSSSAVKRTKASIALPKPKKVLVKE